MEIRLPNGQLRRTQTTTNNGRASAQAVETPSAGNRSALAKEDRLSLSQQAVTYLQEQNQAMQDEAARAAEQNSQEDGGLLDVLSKAIKAMKQCTEIARRIRAGDKVPPEDEQFLMNNDPAGYKLAMATRKIKKDPKEWESVLDKEDDGKQADSESSEESAPSVSEVSASASGGGSSGSGLV